jgi:uncharacterized membrane protein
MATDMSDCTNTSAGREQAIATLLRCGTWIASLVIGAGLAIQWLHPSARSLPLGLGGFALMKAGVALFILLPISRLCLMLFLFLRERDKVYAAISALVLVIIGIGFLAGL